MGAPSRAKSVKRLLIVKMSSIGDIAHALPAVSVIKRSSQDLWIGWVVRERCVSLLEGNPDIDKLYVFPDRTSMLDLLRMTDAIRADRYDAVLDMQGLFASGLVSLMSGAKRRIGLDRNREANLLFMNEGVIPGKDRNRHAIDILYGFAEYLGVTVQHGEVPVQSYLVDADEPFAHRVLNGLARPVVVLNAGASTPQKCWARNNWIELGRRLVASGSSVVLLGASNDKRAVAEIEIGIGPGPHVRNVAGETNLRQVASLVARVDLVISGDTGPLHIAANVGTKCIGLYGPTNPYASGPYGDHNVALWQDLSCAPCHRGPTCGGSFECMTAIAPAAVEKVVMQMLGSGHPGGIHSV